MLTNAVHALRRTFHEAIPWLPALIMTRVLYYFVEAYTNQLISAKDVGDQDCVQSIFFGSSQLMFDIG